MKGDMSALLLIISFLSCSNTEVVYEADDYKIIYNRLDKQYLRYRYFSDGSLKSKECLNSEYENDGVSTSYFDNGKIKLLETFNEGVKEGKEIAYYPSGQIQYEGQFDSSNKNGVWYWYRDIINNDKNLLSIVNYSNDKLFGSQVRFDSLSNTPKIYFYSLDGLMGVLAYNNQRGNNYDLEGELSYIIYNKNTLQVGDTFEILIFVGHGIGNEIDIKLTTSDSMRNKNEINLSIDKIHKYMSQATWTYNVANQSDFKLFINITIHDEEIIYKKRTELPIRIE